MEDLFQVYGASTKQEVLGGIFSKVKQSQTLPAAWVFGLCHGNTEKNSSLLLENISYKCTRILSAKRPQICSSSHNYRSMGTGQRSQLLLQPRFKWNCRKFNEKKFACPHTLAEEEKKLMSFFSLAVVHRQRYFCTPPECSSALLTCAAMYTHRRCIPRACAVSDWAHAQVRRGSAVW